MTYKLIPEIHQVVKSNVLFLFETLIREMWSSVS